MGMAASSNAAPENSGYRTADRALLVVCATIAALLLGMDRGAAQDADGVWIEVSDCLELETTLERFECYERRAERAQAGPGAARGEAERPAAAAPERSRAVRSEAGEALAGSASRPSGERDGGANRDRGGSESSSASAEPARAVEPEPGPEERDVITGTIVSVRERLPNEYIVTLENGQVWHQIVPESYPLRAGQNVRIAATDFFGNSYYRLSAEGVNGFIRVERIE